MAMCRASGMIITKVGPEKHYAKNSEPGVKCMEVVGRNPRRCIGIGQLEEAFVVNVDKRNDEAFSCKYGVSPQ